MKIFLALSAGTFLSLPTDRWVSEMTEFIVPATCSSYFLETWVG